MPTPPPVPADARYPVALRDFVTYQDQPGDGNHIISQNDPSTGLPILTDLTIDSAAVTQDLHTEVISIEKIIGVRPFSPPGCTTVGQSIRWLYLNESPIDHLHVHNRMNALGADDHKEYSLVNGERPFTGPITSPPATSGNQLVNYNQVRAAGYLTAVEFASMINLRGMVTVPLQVIDGPTEPWGTWYDKLKIMGGVAQGYTDTNGVLYVPFGKGFAGVLSFVFMKMPFPGLSMLGYYQYQYVEDQLILLHIDRWGASIQFIEDIQVDRQAQVGMVWQAIGV